MKKTIFEQDSADWYTARSRCLTASTDAAAICAPKGIGVAGHNAINSVIAYHHCTTIRNAYKSFAMQRGTELQGEAAMLLMQSFEGYEVDRTLFAYHDSLKYVGASFDLLLEKEGKYTHIEIKCPEDPLVHWKFLNMANASDLLAAEPKYFWQVIQEKQVINCDVVYFSSYHPDFEPGKQLTLLKIKHEDVTEYIDIWERRMQQANSTILDFFNSKT